MVPPVLSTKCTGKWCSRKKPGPPSMMVICWRLWALALPSVLGIRRNSGFLFLLVYAAGGAVLTTYCFSPLWKQHPGLPQSLCEETGLQVYMGARRTGPWKKSECHLGVSALLMATSSWTLKGGRPSLAWENVPCWYILLAALRLCFSYLLEPIHYQMQARTFPKVWTIVLTSPLWSEGANFG